MKLTAEDVKKHVEMINSPDEWPRWPVLPVKKNINHVGVILAYEECFSKEHGIVVWEVTMFQIPTKQVKNTANEGTHSAIDFDALRNGAYTTYRDAEAVVDAGWQVD